ncbi:MAG: hypothetical protein JNK64_35925 [Myxococcales bacterium]|nr:hypothetical protein [Myxococcales bacterium]
MIAGARRSALAIGLALSIGVAAAQPGAGGDLAGAGAAAERHDWATVERLAAPVADAADAARGDRAEAFRLLGLAALERGDASAAEARFFAYLQLDLDGALDPNVYPPETIAFLENVRAKHATELRALRPRPRRARVLNLLPPAGQFQNQHRTKAWTLAILGGTLLATNLTTYGLLYRWCSDDATCTHASTARVLREVNLATGIATFGLYVYGVWDGFRHFHQSRTPSATIAPLAFSHGAGLGVAGTF